MRAVVDTNTLVSGLLWHGNPSRILDAILENRLELCLSEELLGELTDVLCRQKLAQQVAKRGLNADWSCSFIRDRCLLFSPVAPFELPELRDRKDLPVLAAARAAAADLIITGDKDLLSLNSFAGIPIVDAAEAVTRLGLG